MSSTPATHRETPWFRFVRILVVLYVAVLDRKIARLLAVLDTLEYEDPRYDVINERAYFLEDIRDAYLAWLEDPSNPLPQAYDPNVRWRLRFRIRRPRHAGARALTARIAAARPTRARCTTALRPLLHPPGGGAFARP